MREEIADPTDTRSVGFKHPEGFTMWIDESDPDGVIKNGHLDHLGFNVGSREAVDAAHRFAKDQSWKILNEPKAYPEYGDFYGCAIEGPDKLKIEFVTR